MGKRERRVRGEGAGPFLRVELVDDDADREVQHEERAEEDEDNEIESVIDLQLGCLSEAFTTRGGGSSLFRQPTNLLFPSNFRNMTRIVLKLSGNFCGISQFR